MSEFDYMRASNAIWRAEMGKMDRYVALALLSYWSKASPEPYPSLTELEDRAEMSRAAVNAAIRRLERSGAIKVNKRRTTGGMAFNSYDLSGLMHLPPRPEKSRKWFSAHTSSADELVQQMTASSSADEPKVVHEVNSKKPSKKSIKNGDAPQPPKRAKPEVKQPSKDETDPRVRRVIDHYHSTYREVTGAPPSGDYGRAAKAIAALPTTTTAESVCHAITLQLTQRRGLEFTRGADWNSLPQILAHLDEIRAWTPRKAQGGQPHHTSTNRFADYEVG